MFLTVESHAANELRLKGAEDDRLFARQSRTCAFNAGEAMADGGRLIIPHGVAASQRLTVIDRDGDDISRTDLDMVSFVPLVREK